MWFIRNEVTVRDSGLLEGFCDCHCHLLPGVDDGVREAGESLGILRLWEQAGVREVWLTPHVMEDIPNTTAGLMRRFGELEAAYTGAIRLHLASENMMDGLFLERLRDGDLLPAGSRRDCLLVETSYYSPPMNMGRIVASVRERGLRPVLAHPERYRYMGMDDYRRWKAEGVLLQLNLPSLVGAYGPAVRRKAESLLDRGMYDCCGTDTHSRDFAEGFLDGRIRRKTAAAVRRVTEGWRD